MKLSLDYLPETDIHLYQAQGLFKINTATHLLGNFIQVKPHESVLDIGTNNGALLLYASQYQPKQLVGIEIVTPAVLIARKNMLLNGLTNASIIEIDLKDFQAAPFDVIMANPPYFHSHRDLKQGNYAKRAARQEANLTLADLLKKISELLKPTGRTYLIYNFERLTELKQEVNHYCLFFQTIKTVYDQRSNRNRFVLVELVKNSAIKPVYQTLNIGE